MPQILFTVIRKDDLLALGAPPGRPEEVEARLQAFVRDRLLRDPLAIRMNKAVGPDGESFCRLLRVYEDDLIGTSDANVRAVLNDPETPPGFDAVDRIPTSGSIENIRRLDGWELWAADRLECLAEYHDVVADAERPDGVVSATQSLRIMSRRACHATRRRPRKNRVRRVSRAALVLVAALRAMRSAAADEHLLRMTYG